LYTCDARVGSNIELAAACLENCPWLVVLARGIADTDINQLVGNVLEAMNNNLLRIKMMG